MLCGGFGLDVLVNRLHPAKNPIYSCIEGAKNPVDHVVKMVVALEDGGTVALEHLRSALAPAMPHILKVVGWVGDRVVARSSTRAADRHTGIQHEAL